MSKEIGSDFCKAEHLKDDSKYFLSGRTALDYIIRDIMKSHKVKSALLPSYCCHSMIEPFRRNGIEVRFYDVFPDKESGICVCIPDAQQDEIFYDAFYFGYTDKKGYDRNKIRSQWKILIEDQTHSWLSSYKSIVEEDTQDIDYKIHPLKYSYISYRKWSGFAGIASAKKYGDIFQEECLKDINERYSRLRLKAVAMKEQYLAGKGGEKQEYLSLFHQAEELLETNYIGYRPTTEDLEKLMNLDTLFIIRRRKENAEILVNGLKKVSEIKLLFPVVKEGDVPLFVPILVEEKRDKLRKYLIQHGVYCPIHWPISEWHKGLSVRGTVIYGQELSLICDQRYESEDMIKIVELIVDFFS